MTDEMERRALQCPMLFIETVFSPKFTPNYFIVLSGCNLNGEVQVLGALITGKDQDYLKEGFQQFRNLSQISPIGIVLDSDPTLLSVVQEIFPAADHSFSLFHIRKRIKKLFKGTSALNKALNFAMTDYFSKEFIDLLNPDNPFKLNLDQLNYINFLYQYRIHWNGLFMKTPLFHMGLNTFQRFTKGGPFSKLTQSLTSFQHNKITSKVFKATLESLLQGHQLGLHRFREKNWYRNFFTPLLTDQQVALPPQYSPKFLDLLSIAKKQPSNRLYMAYLFNEYAEAFNRCKSKGNEIYVPKSQAEYSEYAHITQTQGHLIKRRIQKEFEECHEVNEKGCNCSYGVEYRVPGMGELPCRHVFRRMIDLQAINPESQR